jgi:exodeoxyribonuclease V alpha subunit
MIKGIGPHFAKKLVKAFGADVFDVIELTPERLLTLPGIGKKRLE